MTRQRTEARTARVVDLFALRMRGMSLSNASRAAGIHPDVAYSIYQCRTEAEIRADLARQLEGIVRRFEASL